MQQNRILLIICILSINIFSCSPNQQKIAGKENNVVVHSLPFDVNFDTSLNNAQLKMQRDSTGLTLNSSRLTDFFIDPDGTYEFANAPLLLKKVDNTKPFTFTIEMKPEHKVKYDAGMAFVYIDNKHWLKFAFEADERMNTRIVTVRTNETSDDNNHSIVENETVFLKISSDTKAIGFYYSTDNTNWNIVRIFKNEYPANIYLGIGTQSPAGEGNKTLFQGAQLTQEAIKDFRMGV